LLKALVALSEPATSNNKQDQKGELVMSKLIRFLKEEEGVTALEYSLIAALIAVVIIGAVTVAGEQVDAVFTAIGAALTDAVTP
jgi:pilus assembly protein Flp/PilA